MIRRFFVDLVVVLALCSVVWGVVPAVILAQEDGTIHKDDLPKGALVTPTSSNLCCKSKGQSAFCEMNEQANSGMCKDKNKNVDCSYDYTWWFFWSRTQPCSCKTWAYLAVGKGYYTLVT